MRKGISVTGLLSVIACPAQAIDWVPDGVSVAYGQYLPVVNGRKANYNLYRLGLVWDWDRPLYQSESIRLGGFFELGANVWQSRLSSRDNPSPGGKARATVVSFSPVLRLSSRKPIWGNVKPFFDAGVGGAWLSEKDLEKEKRSPINMGGHWQFELRLMTGIQFGERQQYELRYGWLHYSNANLNDSNESIDFHLVTFSWRW